ncbi:unnamed protein product [Spirodela intermedia]|uniref:Uncharacterized protein n=2 Tax=Spirodela intermedia TaxID=51605 RepID=A0A7I8KI64_SPIIN|nr:unnamed protein product [Spirodela intermedia]CAA6661098.1 unnamed protein product [Spirodela intermedia]CAA7397463.1 unnamed protein product [Spirodela intermedia]
MTIQGMTACNKGKKKNHRHFSREPHTDPRDLRR